MSSHPDDIYFLRLAFAHGVGSRAAHKLLTELGDAAAIFSASIGTLTAIVGDKSARVLTTPPDEVLQAKLDEALAWLDASVDHHLLTWAHGAFPKALLESGDAPIVLYAKGRIELLDKPAIAMVGSRSCSQGGADTAEAFAQAFAERGVCVVSGMAEGIDAASHVGALRATNTEAGSTIAVIGTGIDRVYPAKNKVLAHSIAERGLIVSEYPLGTPPASENFPRRNRIISGLSLGVLVVEASMRSGSLITARLAGDQSREVFAIPGSIHSTFHKGCHHLIKQGAKLVETAQDVLEELRIDAQLTPAPEAAVPGARAARKPKSAAKSAAKSTPSDGLIAHIEHTPVDVDTLVSRSGLPVDQVVTELTMLELSGTIEQLAGGRWQRRG
ncbi:MAG: DNA-processing protein DprA [Casimicrobium sp.]